jgi:hypothetical protein
MMNDGIEVGRLPSRPLALDREGSRRLFLREFFRLAEILGVDGTAAATLAIVPGGLNQFDVSCGVIDLKFIFDMATEGFHIIFTHVRAPFD